MTKKETTNQYTKELFNNYMEISYSLNQEFESSDLNRKVKNAFEIIKWKVSYVDENNSNKEKIDAIINDTQIILDNYLQQSLNLDRCIFYYDFEVGEKIDSSYSWSQKVFVPEAISKEILERLTTDIKPNLQKKRELLSELKKSLTELRKLLVVARVLKNDTTLACLSFIDPLKNSFNTILTNIQSISDKTLNMQVCTLDGPTYVLKPKYNKTNIEKMHA